MSTTISDGTHTITPSEVTGYQADRESGNIVHKRASNAGVDITLVGDAPRAGTLQLMFTAASDATAAYGWLSQALTFVLASTDISAIGMTFARTGVMSIELDPETMNAWTLAVPYQEIS